MRAPPSLPALLYTSLRVEFAEFLMFSPPRFTLAFKPEALGWDVVCFDYLCEQDITTAGSDFDVANECVWFLFHITFL